MAASLVDDLAGRALGTTATHDGSRMLVQSRDAAGLVALVLRQKRRQAGLTLKEMARRLGSRSPNAYARYEQGRATPTVQKLSQLFSAVASGGDFVVSESHTR